MIAGLDLIIVQYNIMIAMRSKTALFIHKIDRFLVVAYLVVSRFFHG
jgi:hypothetical protein